VLAGTSNKFFNIKIPARMLAHSREILIYLRILACLRRRCLQRSVLCR
jgi:hypothetical protein